MQLKWVCCYEAVKISVAVLKPIDQSRALKRNGIVQINRVITVIVLFYPYININVQARCTRHINVEDCGQHFMCHF